MKRLCTICARGGSKGLKNKNVKLLASLPLLAHSIRHAMESELFDAIAVSSDSEEILRVAEEYGADYCIKRPEELATDKAAKIPAIQNCVKQVEELSGVKYDILVDLDCTSPLRFANDIWECVKICEQENVSNVITAAESRRSPYFNMVEVTSEGGVQLAKKLESKVVRRQDAPKCYDMNASIYVWKRDLLFNLEGLFHPTTRLYVMPEERSWDIDSELDFEFVEFLFAKRKT